MVRPMDPDAEHNKLLQDSDRPLVADLGKSHETYPERCRSWVYIIPGYKKRCIRAVDHSEEEPHAWIESEDRLDGPPILVLWNGKAIRRYVYKLEEV